MRELTGHKVNGCNEKLRITAGETGHGGAPHVYVIDGYHRDTVGGNADHLTVHFQEGPIKEVGTNGVTHEALLAILEDRLSCFENGPYACEENADALEHIRKAQQCLQDRTQNRLVRGVEGTHEK